MPHETDPTRRFSSRVDDYVRYRPGYPPELLDCVRAVTGLDPSWTVADIGSGTGKLTEVFLRHGNPVFAVEPNAPMREAAERMLSAHHGFTSVAGTAEATSLPDACADIVVAAQAFHWFDPEPTRKEFDRILTTNRDGWVALVWNTRCVEVTPFMRAYERLLADYAVDYRQVDHRNVDGGRIGAFLGAHVERRLSFVDALDFDSVQGRMQSSSYVPAPGTDGYDDIIAALKRAFDAHNNRGCVEFVYETEMYLGRSG